MRSDNLRSELALFIAVQKINNQADCKPAEEPCPIAFCHTGEEVKAGDKAHQWYKRVFFYKRCNSEKHGCYPEYNQCNIWGGRIHETDLSTCIICFVREIEIKHIGKIAFR